VTCVTASEPVKPSAEPAEPPIVGPDLNQALRTTACPSCGAGLRPDAQWCSLCYHDLRPAAAPVVAPQPSPEHGGDDPLTAPLLDLLLPTAPATAPVAPPPAVPVPMAAAPVAAAAAEVTWPCTRCGAHNALTANACRDCGSPFLGGAAEAPALVLPGVGDLAKLSRGNRAAVAVGLVLAVLLPLALITFLMTPTPKKDGGGTETTVTVVK
jgi:ribosomal protein L40E